MIAEAIVKSLPAKIREELVRLLEVSCWSPDE